MRSNPFLRTIIDERKLSLVEPSRHIYSSYTQKAENSLKAAKLLLANTLLEESIAMCYYAMFHKTVALLRLIGIKCENHAATILLLKELFGLDNKEISFAKEERIDKQYYTDSALTQADTKELVNKAEQFIALLDEFSEKLTSAERTRYHDEFKRMYFPT